MTGNPARDVKRLKTPEGGHHTWTLDEVRRFEQRWSLGSKPRLAMALMLLTSHGLRKASATTLAEIGASTYEVAAILGAESLQEAEKYTRAARQKLLATRALARFTREQT